MRALTLAALAVLMATGCAPTEGEVINASHRSAHTETSCSTDSTGCTQGDTHADDRH